MEIFRNRPFAAALALVLLFSLLIALFALSGVASQLSAVTLAVIVVTLAVILLAIAVAFLASAIRKPHVRTRRLMAMLGMLIVLVGVLRSGGYFLLGYANAQRLVGQTVTVTLEILECELSTAGYTRYRANAKSVTSCDSSEPLPAVPSEFDAILLLETAAEYRVGDRLLVTAECAALSELYGDATYAAANGAFLGFLPIECTEPVPPNGVDGTDPDDPIAYDDPDALPEPTYAVTVLSRATDRTLSVWERVLSASRSLQVRIAYVFTEELGGEVGALAAAVLCGERSALDGSLTRDFSRAGVAHLLAISGLHMTVLIGGLAALLRKLTLPRWAISVGMLLSVLAFLLLTGFSPSACRAGVMLAFAAVLGFFSRTPEPMTSLFLAVVLLLLVDPAATVSAGLWMSFASVLGLLLFGKYRKRSAREKTEKTAGLRALLFRICKRILGFLLTGIGVSLVASFSTLPILAATGGEFSLYAPLTNLLTVSLMPLFLALSIAFLAVYPMNFFGPTVAALLRLIGGWTVSVASFVSDLPRATVSLRFPFAWVAAAVFAVPTVLMLTVPADPVRRILRTARRRTPREGSSAKPMHPSCLLLPPCAAVILYLVCFLTRSVWFSATVPIPATVTDASAGEMLVLQRDGVGVLVDLSDGRFTGYRNAREAASAHGVTEWSAVVLTHYHSRMSGSLSRFCRESLVREVYFPAPVTPNDYTILRTLSDRLDAIGVPYTVYTHGEELRLGRETLVLSPPAYLDRSAEPTFFLTVSSQNMRLTYCTQAVLEGGLRTAAEAAIVGSEFLVYGSDGPKPQAIIRIPTERSPTVLTLGDEILPYISPISLRELEAGAGIRIHGELPTDLWRVQAPKDEAP